MKGLWVALAALMVLSAPPADAGIFKKAVKAVVYTQGAKTAGKFIAKKMEERAAKKSAQMAANRQQGKLREKLTEEELRHEYPNASVQREQYLRDAEGNVAKDGLTSTGRRIDHVVVEDGQVVRKIETTGLTTSKDAQIAKERRILESGGRYVRDRETGDLIDAGPKTSEIIRRK